MAKRWKPNATQRAAFKAKMSNPAEAEAYEQRKREKADKRRAASQFDYGSAGGWYVPTKEQHDYAVFSRPAGLTQEQEDACNIVASGYALNDKVHHDFIHIVNELRRAAL